MNQYFTPTWAAALLVQRHFPDLGSKDTIWEPTCGDGRFLLAIPSHVRAFGTEIDPVQAEAARRNTGRPVTAGDFRTALLPAKPTAVIGNPPFELSLIQDLLSRCYDEMEYGGRVGLILPAYIFQTANTLLRMAKDWSIGQEMIPRNLFPGLEKPLLFANFRKDAKTVLSGFFLYAETSSLDGMKAEFKDLFIGNNSKANVWHEAVRKALEALGGTADTQQVYQLIENNRPTQTKFWREKIRQTLRSEHRKVQRGVYQLKETA